MREREKREREEREREERRERETRQHKTTQDTPRHTTQQDKVQDQSLHNTTQDGTGSLPCGPRIVEEKESGFPALSRLKSAEAGESTGGAGGGG